jgi:beta-lactamase class A
MAALTALAACSSSHTTTRAPTLATTTTTAAPTTTTTTAPHKPLQAVVDDAAANRAVAVSLAVINLATGERADHLGRRVVLSASLYKLFVAREVFRRIAAGQLSPQARSGDGRHDVADCLRLMVTVSDDACGVAGLHMVGGGGLDPALHRDGFADTSLASPQRTSAHDVAELLKQEHDGHTALYQLLTQQQVNDRIPPALPPGRVEAHKTGDRTGWAHDAAIVKTADNNSFVVAVLTGPWPAPCCHEERIGSLERQAFALIGDVARRVYDGVSAA